MKPKLPSNPIILTAAFTAAFGFLLSLLISLFSGGGFFQIILRSFVSAMITGIMGAGVVLAIQMIMPDFIEQLQKAKREGGENDQEEEGALDGNMDDGDDLSLDEISGDLDAPVDEFLSGIDEGATSSSSEIKIDEAEITKQKQGGKKGQKRSAKNDEFMVGDVPLKDDPELMAEAVRHVLDSEDD